MEFDYQIEVFHEGEWRPLYGTATDGNPGEITPGEYVARLSKIIPTPTRVRPDLKDSK